MSREVPFDETEKCDACGEMGAFDFMGDLLCTTCSSNMMAEVKRAAAEAERHAHEEREMEEFFRRYPHG